MTSSRRDRPPAGEGDVATGRRLRQPVRLSFGPQTFIKKGLASFDPHDPYYFAISLSWTGFALLFVAAELAINLVFATLYSLQPGSVAHQSSNIFLDNFFFSLETLATVGYGEMYPATRYGHVVTSLEIMTGVIFTAIITGLLFVRFSRPKAKVIYATNAVITPHDGKQTFMLRIGNARNSLLHNTSVNLHVLCRRTSVEGLSHAAVVELPLLRPTTPVFAILYTIMHVIDEASPLHGLRTGDRMLDDLRFFLTINAHDPAIGSKVVDIHAFDGTCVRSGMRYVEAVRTIADKVVLADYSLLSAIEPADGTAPVFSDEGATIPADS